MKYSYIWEHNGDDSLVYISELPGAYARGANLEEALTKLPKEILSFSSWLSVDIDADIELLSGQEKESELKISDADSDVIFDSELHPLSMEEYIVLRDRALRSAADFLRLYESVPEKDESVLPRRESFYGSVPGTAREMYEHTKNVNAYYFGELDVAADNEGTILQCREKGFETLEAIPGFLEKPPVEGSYGEVWSLRKLLRRFIWHDRIHAKAMYRMAEKTFGKGSVENAFSFIL